MRVQQFGWSLIVLLMAASAQAKVFNGDESLAAYISGTWGPSYENTLASSSNTDILTAITLNSKHPYNMSGEFGFIYATTRSKLRFGLEVIRPKEIQDESGQDSNGNSLYSLTSETSVLIPKAGVEVHVENFGSTRMVLSLAAGYASLAARNSYVFTTAGNTTYSGLANFYEDLRGYATMYEGSLGFEGLLADMTTYFLNVGYRNLKFEEIKHNRDITPFSGNPVVKGDVAKNIDGSNRTLDLTNYFIGISFRFWIR